MSAAVIHAGTAMPFDLFSARRHYKLDTANAIRADKCRPPLHFGTQSRDIRPWKRRANLAYQRVRVVRARARASRCLPTSPRAIIRYVFPAATEDAAIRVAGCETGWTYNVYATNASSGAAGLFQLLPFHWQGLFNPYDPWANSRYAYRLSHAGYDWGAWICQP